jgi:hypothetical protein
MTTFLNDDLVFYKNSAGNIMSGGYNVESHMLQNGISPMQTFNLSQNGGKDDKVSSVFENLAIPAGLYYITQPNSKNNKYKDQKTYNKEHVPLSDDIFDKLFEMIEYDDKRKRKTKKQNIHIDNGKLNKTKNKKTKKYKE